VGSGPGGVPAFNSNITVGSGPSSASTATVTLIQKNGLGTGAFLTVLADGTLNFNGLTDTIGGLTMTGGATNLQGTGTTPPQGNLTVNGTLKGNNIQVYDSGYSLTLVNNTVVTNGVARPSGALSLPQLTPYEPSINAPGAYFSAANVTQVGNTDVRAINNFAVLQIGLSGNLGSIGFNTLSAANTWLILQTGSNGSAISQTQNGLTIRSLDVIYTGVVGASSLSGAIDGVSGDLAAALAHIYPDATGQFRFDGTPLQTVRIVVQTTTKVAVPVQKGVDQDELTRAATPANDPDLVQILPNVSNRDY
jgi:hypothetical protein